MTRNLIIFLATFVVGAVVALGARAVRHNPHVDSAETNRVAQSSHAGHEQPSNSAQAKAAPAAAVQTVNSVCAICGMDVDPALPVADYKGHKVGFGCVACPPKFARNPDKWGPSALKNEILED